MQRVGIVQATAPSTGDRAGWPLKDFLPLVGFGVTTFHTMGTAKRPRYIKVGKKIIVIEAPKDYLSRLARMQETETSA